MIDASMISFRSLSERAISSHDQVARALGMEILAGKHLVGSNLPNEADLLARFQISRTVLREVLKTLSAKGLLAAKARVGTRVTHPVHWNLFDAEVLSWKVAIGLDDDFRRDMAEIRRLIEPRAAALAAERRAEDAIAAIRTALDRMRIVDQEAVRFAQADLDFHLAIGAASGNLLMRSIASVIETALAASFSPIAPREHPELHAETVAKHEAILDAIVAGDAAAASAAMLGVINDAAPRNEGGAGQHGTTQ
ncbi:FadR/GntR family transcriptional regulator [Sphingomonas psychrotolerans]|nr:FCD domain-containing protein [Sphingomonas psychrotolerans]